MLRRTQIIYATYSPRQIKISHTNTNWRSCQGGLKIFGRKALWEDRIYFPAVPSSWSCRYWMMWKHHQMGMLCWHDSFPTGSVGTMKLHMWECRNNMALLWSLSWKNRKAMRPRSTMRSTGLASSASHLPHSFINSICLHPVSILWLRHTPNCWLGIYSSVEFVGYPPILALRQYYLPVIPSAILNILLNILQITDQHLRLILCQF